jgi:hypothetical protein
MLLMACFLAVLAKKDEISIAQIQRKSKNPYIPINHLLKLLRCGK